MAGSKTIRKRGKQTNELKVPRFCCRNHQQTTDRQKNRKSEEEKEAQNKQKQNKEKSRFNNEIFVKKHERAMRLMVKCACEISYVSPHC